MISPTYLHLKPGEPPPVLEKADAFKAVLVIEDEVTAEWRSAVSDWLVDSGCRYMMAWGRACGAWDDSVDWASLKFSDFRDVPDDEFVMTTWHEQEPLEDVFWFSTHAAMHRSLELSRIYILHIAQHERSAELLESFRRAQNA